MNAHVDAQRLWIDSRAVAGPSNGDFVTVFPLDRDRFAVVVGDVAGRGPVAGGAAHALAGYARDAIRTRVPLRTALAHIDDYFCRAVRSDEVPLATIALLVIDRQKRFLEYASAGHEPALFFQHPASHDHLPPTGPVLGLDPGVISPFAEGRAPFSDRSFVVIVTDGITEARRYDRGDPQFFGSSGVLRSFVAARRAGTDPARAIVDASVRYADGIARDDATALVIALGA